MNYKYEEVEQYFVQTKAGDTPFWSNYAVRNSLAEAHGLYLDQKKKPIKFREWRLVKQKSLKVTVVLDGPEDDA